ncbi:MAG: hypothetical protein SCABRO_02417 [Candidatus Scalindua brodae]|uniref:Uncharacterized protein n=1 Tax=Candidatus Scalindua brodae TaxID=237368 RepID=A0A0B0EFF8_9BACT|nr:MAG: hypothetical protein SCABRO_02417 [Candidatus Scalindua brodae]
MSGFQVFRFFAYFIFFPIVLYAIRCSSTPALAPGGPIMSIFKEVLDGLDAVAKAIENVKKIREAISEGKGYIDVKHPDVKSDLGLLLNEFRKTINGVAQASSVLTNFRFAISADAGARSYGHSTITL